MKVYTDGGCTDPAVKNCPDRIIKCAVVDESGIMLVNQTRRRNLEVMISKANLTSLFDDEPIAVVDDGEPPFDCDCMECRSKVTMTPDEFLQWNHEQELSIKGTSTGHQ